VVVHRSEGVVEREQDLRARAEVGRQGRGPARGFQALAARAEDLDVGMAEGVDRLQLVTHGAGVVARHQLEQLELQGVRVLELVDHDALEALAVTGSDAGLAGQQVAGQQLEVVEVDAAASALGRRVGVGVAPQQFVDEGQGRDGQAIGERVDVGVARRAIGVGGGGLQRTGVARHLRPLRMGARAGVQRGAADLERLARGLDGRAPVGARELGGERRVRALQRRARGAGIGRARRRQRRARLPARAQRVVRAEDHALQAVDGVGGGEVERIRARRGEEVGQRGVEGLALGGAAVGRIEDGEGGVEAGRHRVRAQDPRAEAVEGRDPRRLGLARRLAVAELEQARAHARAQLARRLLGEGDGQDLVGAQAVLHHRGDEALDQHRRLARAGVGREHEVALAARDGLALLGGEGARHAEAASQRQMVGCAQPPRYAHEVGSGTRRPSGCRAPPAAPRRGPPAAARRTPRAPGDPSTRS
jgi:hypothetical protein